jgi:hypothetical protein
MRKLLGLFLILLLTGCASPKNSKLEEFRIWSNFNLQQAQLGKIKWSEFYSEGYQRMEQFNSSQEIAMTQRMLSELIPHARRFESGKISKEEFQDLQRSLMAQYRTEIQATKQKQQSINDAQAQQLYQLGNQILQPRNPTTNCLTTKVGPNTLSTNCN